jgi:hypothetical protein
MYATLHTIRRAPVAERWAADLAASLRDQDGCVGLCVLGELAGSAGAVVALWSDEERATAAAARPGQDRAAHLLTDAGALYRVLQADAGAASDRRPVIAQVLRFDGPRSAEQAAADARSGERVWPAIRVLDGVVGSYALSADDRGLVVVLLTESVESLEAIRRVVMTTMLLPDEDPALLTGPDRIEIHRVHHADLPALSPTPGA